MTIDQDFSELAELQSFARKLRNCWESASEPKWVVWMQGPMGVGKTEFVRSFVSEASSPSFSLHQVYQMDRGEVSHWDLDRIDSAEAFASIGFWDQFSTPGPVVVFVEWSERIEEVGGTRWAPADWVQYELALSFSSDNKRHILLHSY